MIMRRITQTIGLMWLFIPTSGFGQTFEPAFAAWVASAEQAISTIAIDTRQHSASSEQTAVAMNSGMKALSQTMVEMEVSAQLRTAITRSESMQTGITGLCANVSMSNAASNARQTDIEVREALSQYERDWATNGGSRADILAATQAIRRGVMCTASEMALGLCDEDAENMTGVVPAGDTNAQTWLLRRSYGTQEAEIGAIYVDTIAPPPTMETADEASASVEQLVRRAGQRRQLALISIARGALMDVVVGGLEGGTE